MKPKLITYINYFIAIMCMGASANAQKLPNVQPTGFYAPANVKIDGKPSEWKDQFQAYNKTSSLYYTLANDAENLILVMHTTYDAITNKLLWNKFTFNIKGKNGSISLTPQAAHFRVNRILSTHEPVLNDSLHSILTSYVNGIKQIAITGIPAITNPNIPIYNEYGIAMSIRVDKNKAYTCELAIPFKYITPVLDGSEAFNYSIKIHGQKMPEKGIRMVDGKFEMMNRNDMPINANDMLNGFPMLLSVSEAEIPGTYTLIKK